METITESQIIKKINPNTRSGRFLAALQRGEKISTLDAWKRFGLGRASEMVRKWREKGYSIKTIMVREKGICYGIYQMEKK